MKLTLHGKEYRSDFASLGKLTIGDARVIKQEFGMSIDQVQSRLAAMASGVPSDINTKLETLAIIAYLVTSRSGDPIEFAELNRIPIEDLPKVLDFTDDLPTTADVKSVAPKPASAPDAVLVSAPPTSEAASD